MPVRAATREALTRQGATRRVLARSVACGVLALGSVVVGPAVPAAAYERTGAFSAPSAGSGSAASLAAGLTVTITTGTVQSAASPAGSGSVPPDSVPSGSVTVAGPVAYPGDAATTSPAGMSKAPATSIRITDTAPVDSTYRPLGTITVTFSQPVRNARLHVYDLGATAFATRLVVTGGTDGSGQPVSPALVPRAGWTGWTVSSTQIAPTSMAIAAGSDCDSGPLPRGCGSVQLLGVVQSVTFRADGARTSISRASTATDDVFDLNASADEDLGNAPASYGGAGHILSDLTIGAAVTADNTTVLTDGSGLSGGSNAPVQAADSNDANVAFPPLDAASAGHPYTISVPVAEVSRPAELAGWIDFNDNGRFDAAERATAAVPADVVATASARDRATASGSTVQLTWASVPTVVPGTARPVRLRLGYDAAQVDQPTGLADSGEVEDTTMTIRHTAPAITAPSAGALLRSRVPVISGTAEPGGTVTVAEQDGAALCTAAVTASGTWACTPAPPLPDRAHTVIATSLATDGDREVAAGRSFTVDATAPGTPTFVTPTSGATLASARPALDGAGEPGSSITVTATAGTPAASSQTGATAGGHASAATVPGGIAPVTAGAAMGAGVGGTAAAPANGERATACATTVAADGTWSCDPTAPFADGAVTLTVAASDAAGNTATGASITLTIDTTPPPPPVITSPRDGATIGAAGVAVASAAKPATAEPGTAKSGSPEAGSGKPGSAGEAVAPGAAVRPQISGTGEPGDTVTVADGVGGAVCVATVAPNGTWACAAMAPMVDGPLSLTPTATDLAGNSTVGDAVHVVVDTTAPPAPVLTSPANGASTNDTTPVVSGLGQPGDTVRVTATTPTGTSGCVATVTVAGTWSCQLTTPLPGSDPSGVSSTGVAVALTATESDKGGNTTTTTPVQLFVDTVPPPPAVLANPAGGAYVNSARPVLTGTSEPSDTIVVGYQAATRDAAAVTFCVTVADPTGAWTCVPLRPLPEGAVTLTVTARDRAGNATTGMATPGATVSLTVDTTPPPAATIDQPGSGALTNNPRPQLSGHGEPGDTIEVTDGSGASICAAVVGPATDNAAVDGTWTCTPTAALDDGQSTVTPTATDRAGNVTPGVASVITVDTTPPPPATFDRPAAGSYVTTPTPVVAGLGEPGDTVTVASSAGTAICRAVIGSSATGSGTWTCAPARALADGGWHLIATATDPAGNSDQGSSTVSFTVDTTPPPPARITSPANGIVTNNTRPTVIGTGEVADLISVRAGGTLVCTAHVAAAGTWTCHAKTALADGNVTLQATATDRAGNSTPGDSSPGAQVDITVDTTPPPAAQITTPAAGETLFTDTPVIGGTGEPDDTVVVEGTNGGTVCVATVPADGSWSCPTADALPDGAVTLNTYASDVAGNITHGTPVQIRIDSSTPIAAVITSPADGATVADATPQISGTGEAGDTVSVVTSTASSTTATVCVATVGPAGTWSCRPSTALREGAVTLLPMTVDGAGSEIPGSPIEVVVDTVPPPAATITSPTNGSTVTTATPRIAGTGEADDDVEVTDGLGTSVCYSTVTRAGTWSCAPAQALTAGDVVLTPTATDPAGNVTPGTPVTVTVHP